MIDPLISAVFGRCPACQKGQIYQSFLRPHPTCPVCQVRFERWEGSWTIPVVMGYGSGALFAFALGFWYHKAGELKGAEDVIIPATLAFTALWYPLCKNLSFGLLFVNGFIYPDPPRLVQPPAEPPAEPGQPEAPRSAPVAPAPNPATPAPGGPP